MVKKKKDSKEKSNSKRVPTGIEGFDGLCGGGLLRNRSYLLSGPAGAGKTIFGLQYLYNGISKYRENGIYIATEEQPDQIRENASEFGWDFDTLEDEGKLAIIDSCTPRIGKPPHEEYVDVDPFNLRSIMEQLIALQDTIDAKRVLFDSTTSIGFYLQDPSKIRVELLRVSTILQILGLTSILTCELLEDDTGNSRFGIEQFIADGVIRLSNKQTDDLYISTISIIKMRGSKHSKYIHPFEITSSGIVIHS